MAAPLEDELRAFSTERLFNRKGPLYVALVMTQQARASPGGPNSARTSAASPASVVLPIMAPPEWRPARRRFSFCAAPC
jgi:hypothetical protein